MAVFTILSAAKDVNEAMADKMEMFVSMDGKATGYKTCGVVRNESTFNVTPDFIEYKDGFSNWLISKSNETLTFEGAFMQVTNPELFALAVGKNEVTGTTTDAYRDVLFTSTRVNPPPIRVKWTGTNQNGKDIEIEFLKGQIRSDMAWSWGTDVSELPFILQAVKDDTSTELYDVARFRVEQ